MKKIIVIALLLPSQLLSFAQNQDVKTMVDSLQYLKADTLDCSADLYWRIIAKGDKAIPSLIDKLTDTIATNVKFHCKNKRLNVGEIAQFALIEIASFPAFLVTKIQFDSIIIDDTGKECWSFYDFLFINANKPRYQKNVKDWYYNQKAKFKTEKISKNKLTNCQKLFHIDKYYRWVE